MKQQTLRCPSCLSAISVDVEAFANKHIGCPVCNDGFDLDNALGPVQSDSLEHPAPAAHPISSLQYQFPLIRSLPGPLRVAVLLAVGTIPILILVLLNPALMAAMGVMVLVLLLVSFGAASGGGSGGGFGCGGCGGGGGCGGCGGG